MAELCLMASHIGASELGIVFPLEQGFSKILKEDLSCRVSNQDRFNSLSLNSSSLRKEQWKSASGILDCSSLFNIESTFKRTAFSEVPGTHTESEFLSFGITKQCNRHERILKLLAMGSMGIDGCLQDLSMLYDLMWPQTSVADILPFMSDHTCCFNDAEPLQSLVYPSKEIYFNEPLVELVGDFRSCTENLYHLDGQLQYTCSKTEKNDVLSVVSALHLSKNTNKSHKQTMLVPYFEKWRKRAHTKLNASKLVTETVRPLKSHDKVKEKTSQKNKSPSKSGKERDRSNLHAFEILLSTLVNKKQQSKSSIHSLKKSSPQLPQLLTQFSASIAGAGIAVVLSVVCRAVFSRDPFCASRLLSTGLGLILLSLSSAVHKLRDTVVYIGKTSAKTVEKEYEMMNHLERNMKDIYLRVVALMTVLVLRVV